MKPQDTYGSVQGKYGELHDWYLIVLALAFLWVLMKFFPKWGMLLGWVVLLLAILSSPQAVLQFQNLTRIIQTGTLTGLNTSYKG